MSECPVGNFTYVGKDSTITAATSRHEERHSRHRAGHWGFNEMFYMSYTLFAIIVVSVVGTIFVVVCRRNSDEPYNATSTEPWMTATLTQCPSPRLTKSAPETIYTLLTLSFRT
ncbi:hypothetical protein LSAT2_030707 [Lamellibrachia satsuma]|nr:hypothetical protein LSAT2_030707 [Lamellibrachia satsuma]